MTEALSLHDKLVKAAGEAGYVQKSERNTAQGYNYAGDEAITTEFRQAVLKQGVLVYPVDIEVGDIREFARQGKDVPNVLVTLRGTFKVTDGASEFFTSGVGQGIDIGDKAIYKALTGLKKYVYRFLLMMATGDDPEKSDEPAVRSSSRGTATKVERSEGPRLSTAEQRNEIKALAERAGLSTDQLKALRANHSKAATPAQMTADEATALLEEIKVLAAAVTATGGEAEVE